jgi:F420-dependent oxidoreductase-like protein
MKIGLMLDYTDDFLATARDMRDLEAAGLDQVWIPEPYGFDAISQVGFLAARTERVEIGTGIINAYSRTAALVAMTASGCDYLSGGRFNLGLGASGPQVIEGFHGLPYEKPMQRIIEYIESCRSIWRREPYTYEGRTITAPLRPDRGTGLGKAIKLIQTPVRERIPVWWASLMTSSVAATAAVAEGWLPTMFLPERHRDVWGRCLDEGNARRDPALGPLQIATGGRLDIDDGLTRDGLADALAPAAVSTALYVGGMGARDKNFYNQVFAELGYESAAKRIQDRYLSGDRSGAVAAVPTEWLTSTNLVGPGTLVAERVAAYGEAGVTSLLVTVGGPDRVGQIARLRAIVDR